MNKLNIDVISYLQSINGYSNIELEKVAELYEAMRKELQLKEFCDTNKIKYRESINQYYLVVKRKQFTAKSRQELVDKLYNHFCGISVTTFNVALREWLIWRRDNGTNSKTLKENYNEYHKFIEGTTLDSMQVTKITIINFENYFYEITRDYAITSKRLSNIISVLNGVMKRCISRGIIAHNLLSDVDMKIFRNRCKPVNTSKDNYAVDERNRILDYLKDKTDIYSLAIRFSFYLPLRISETSAIKYSDIQDGILSINRAKRTIETMDDELNFSNKKITNEERIKGNKESGFRNLYLTKSALEIVELTHSLYPDTEYLFMRNGQQIITDTFNEQLKKICHHLGIKYRPSHQLRFTIATMLYESGMSITQLATILGHANTSTTWRYIRKKVPSADTKAIMHSALE